MRSIPTAGARTRLRNEEGDTSLGRSGGSEGPQFVNLRKGLYARPDLVVAIFLCCPGVASAGTVCCPFLRKSHSVDRKGEHRNDQLHGTFFLISDAGRVEVGVQVDLGL